MDELDILRTHESSAAKDRGILPEPPFFARGQGARLWDTEGREYIDFISGSAVSNSGHGNAVTTRAAIEQLQSGLVHVGPLFVTPQKAQLIQTIVDLMPPELSRVHLTVTGGEAIEAALKVAKVHTGRQNIIAFWGAYHGRPMGALGLTAHRSYRDQFFPLTIGTQHFAYPYPYRNPFGLPPSETEEILRLSLSYLDAALSDPASGLSPTAAIFVEPIQGVGGIVVPPPGFMSGLRAICDKHGIVLVSDEIFCGFGRTGTWFGFQHDGVVPDIAVISKGLSGGLPISAIVGREELMSTLPGGIQSTTFEGNPVIAAVAVANVEFLRSIDAPAMARRIGSAIEAWASTIEYPGLAEARGKGALWGLEIVQPGSTTPDAGTAKRIQQEALRQGLLLYAGGHYGNVVGLIPPLVTTDEELTEGLQKLSRVFATVTAPEETLVAQR